MPHQDNTSLANLGIATTGIGATVRARNVGKDTWVDKYNNQRYVIDAGSDVMIPYEALLLWMGDPESRDVDARRRDRTEELQRLRVRYGAYDDAMAWEQNRPHLEMWTVDGERIVTVVDDPDLDSPLLPTSGGFASDDAMAALAERVRVLSAELDAVKSTGPVPVQPAQPSPFTQESTTGTPIGPLPEPEGLTTDTPATDAPPADLPPVTDAEVEPPKPAPVDTPRQPRVKRN